MPDFFKNFFKSSHGSSFRTDIAGIRGIAVMLVALAHFEIPGFGGGFIGPDIFFVLSGYLITGLLVKEYSKNISKRTGRGRISLGAFYLRRTRRILPASLFVLLCINIYARLNMNVLQVAQIKTDSIWTVLFGANINFLRQATDYFAQNNAVSPLQHYWSLAVEEQFYFVWPVLFLTAASFHKINFRGRDFDWHQRLRAVFIALGIGSFAWMLVEFTTSPTTAYFSTFSRAWELALGGALSLLSVERIAARLGRAWTTLRGVALAAMVGSIAVVTPTNFGYTLVVPAVATGFLLISGAQSKDDPVYRLLSSKPLTALGAISFSMYLWHWPVFVFGRNLDLMNTLTQRLFGVVVCILLGTVSYWLVERTFLEIPLPKLTPRPNYNGRAGLATSRIFTSAVTVLVVAGLGLVTYPSSSASEGTEVTAWVPPETAAMYAPANLEAADGGDSGALDYARMKVGLAFLESGATETHAQTNVHIFDDAKNQWNLKVAAASADVSKKTTPRMKVSFEKVFAIKSPQLNPLVVRSCQELAPKTARMCDFGNPAGSKLWLFVGDSHTEMFTESFRTRILQYDDDIHAIQFVSSACPNSLDIGGLDSEAKRTNPAQFQACIDMHAKVLDFLQTYKPDVTIFSDNALRSGDYQAYQTGLRKFLKAANKASRRVVVLGQTPLWQAPRDCLNQTLSNTSQCSGSNVPVLRAVSAQKSAARKQATFIDVSSLLCRNGICPLVIDGIPVSFDSNHLTWQMANELGPVLMSYITSGLKS